MKIKMIILINFLITILLVNPINSRELSPDDYRKMDTKLSLLLDHPELKPLVFAQMKGSKSVENISKINVLMKTNLSRSALNKLGVKVYMNVGEIVTSTLNIDQIQYLVIHPEISYIQGPGIVSIHNDVSTSEIRAVQVRQQYNLTGKGVIIGIVDTGIDWRHLDFRNPDGTTRIKALLDFSDPGDIDGDGDLDGPDQFGGTLYTEQEINNALEGVGTVNQKDVVGHGTHVAGSAAGNGRATGNGIPAGTYVGVAPEADLVIVKATRVNGIYFDPYDFTNATFFVDSVARALNKPYVINLSLGGQIGPHDGKDLSEQAIDNLLTAPGAKGNAVVVSAGNDGNQAVHSSGTFSSSQTNIEIKFNVPTYTPNTETSDDYVVFEGWYDGIFNYSIKVTSPTGETIGPVNSGNESGKDTKDGAIVINNSKGGPKVINGDKQLLIKIFDNTKSQPPKQGIWKISLSGSSGRFDLWLSGSSMDATISSNVDSSMVVATPATAFNAITVGAYVTKKRWTDLDGNVLQNPSLIINSASSFSSQGPTRDCRLKPEIAAPGELIAASYSADAPPSSESSIFKSSNSQWPNAYINRDGKHGLSQGTSFAAPHISGLVALMLEKNPELNISQIREAIITSARSDQYTLSVPNNKWGYGKVDALGTVQHIAGQGQEKKFTTSIFQNPAFTQYIDFYLLSKYTLESVPTATIQIGNMTPNSITMTEIEQKIYKGEYQFNADGTATLKINATIQGESPTTLTEYFSIKLLRANSGGTITFDKVNLFVPQHNLHQDTYFIIIPEQENTSGIDLPVISKAYQVGPTGFQFSQPATLTFIYDDGAVLNCDESKISIYVYENENWRRLKSSINIKTNMVSTLIDRLGIYKIFYDPDAESVENLPITFQLDQNYPNPFNASTIIEYQLPHDIQLTITIFNLQGKLIKTLFQGTQQAGYHKILWDGKNMNNQTASSGLYICRFDSEQFSTSQKMLLLK
jgi:subtilisin family serine protease